MGEGYLKNLYTLLKFNLIFFCLHVYDGLVSEDFVCILRILGVTLMLLEVCRMIIEYL